MTSSAKPVHPTSKTTESQKAAVILLSGGLDSATVLAMAQAEGYVCHCLAFSYGQRHKIELECAARLAEVQGAASFQVVDIDLRAFGGSALTSDVPVPKSSTVAEATTSSEIPVTYVPARNTIFLSFALAKAEVVGAAHLFIGANAVDYSGYPDCRPEFIAAFENLANLATKAGVSGEKISVHAPLMSMGKGEIIQTGVALGVDYALTHSCYDPTEAGACRHCDSCLLRHQGFVDAGIEDPTIYDVNRV